jgi:hypothetical protein
MPDRLPLASAKRLLIVVRKRYFTIDRPSNMPGVLVDAEVDEIDSMLRNAHGYEGAQYYSYNYRDEVLNLRKPDGTETGEDGKEYQMEVHVRAFHTASGELFLTAHRERSRFEHWEDHVNDVDLSWMEGTDAMYLDLTASVDDAVGERVRSSDVEIVSSE